MKKLINIFVELGQKIESGIPNSIASQAVDNNKWFTVSDIDYAAKAISQNMLNRDKLEYWISSYKIKKIRQERILIVMAGNIPLVSFFDLLCVVMAGDIAIVKPSHKDRILMEWTIDQLCSIDPNVPIFIYKDGDDIDRVIATGGDAAMQHFAYLYDGEKALLRGSRHSVAVLPENDMSIDDTAKLNQDIYRYSGLGCRNVSMIFTPKGFDINKLIAPKDITLNTKYLNNYRQNKALITMNGDEFTDNGTICLVYQNHFPSKISTLAIVEYDNIESVNQWLDQNDNQLQCIVAHKSTITHPRRVDFGEAQRPSLFDYADGVDTMKFLM